MFSKNKNTKHKTNYAQKQNKIAEGTVFTGDIEAKGCFRIEGTVLGNIETPGKIVLSETGRIEGDVTCGDADFQGKFKGKLTIKNNLIIKSTSTIDGDVVTEKLSIEPGARLNGTCTMKGALKKLNDDSKQKTKQGASA